ncbi:MAG: chemotaxis protein CheW [Coxiellaceae bacterium]|nr:chemotaxis protein CheW [Coxiellaceae bacterium]
MENDQSQKQGSDKVTIIDENTIQLVIVHLGEQEFGAPISQVREVIRYKQITAVPDCPEYIAGLASFHGDMALVIDLARYFSINQQNNSTSKHIIVIRQDNETYGLLVDEVSQIIRVPESSIKPAPDLIHQINREYISGVYAENEDRLIMVLDLMAILSEDSLNELSGFKKDTNNTSTQ